MSIRNGLLALLAQGPTYGYELKKAFEESTAELWPLNVGQVYTTIGRLVRDGLVAESEEGGEDAGQKRYRLTEDGRAELAEWFAGPRTAEVPERDEVVIKVVMAAATGAADVREVTDAQRRATSEALQRLTRAKSRLGEGDLARILAFDAVITRVEAELRWLELVDARVAGTKRGGKR